MTLYYCVTQETYDKFYPQLKELKYQSWALFPEHYFNTEKADFLHDLGMIVIVKDEAHKECNLLGETSTDSEL